MKKGEKQSILHEMEENKSESFYKNYRYLVSLYLKRDLVKLRRELNKKSVDRVPRNLINARLLNLKGDDENALSLLSETNTSDTYFAAQKEIVRALIYGRLSNFQKASIHNTKAFELARIAKDNSTCFLSSFNLSLNYQRLNLETVAKFYLDESEKYAITFSEIASIERARVSRLSLQGHYQLALERLDRVIDHPEFHESEQKYLFYNLKADILIRVQDFKEAKRLLSFLKGERAYKNRPRVLFEEAIVNFLISSKKIKKLPQDYDANSEYGLLWRCLLEVQAGDPDHANEFWKKLIKLNPERYTEDFKHKMPGDLMIHFQQAFEKLKKSNDFSTSLFQKGSRISALYQCLKDHGGPLRKELIIERVWGVSYDPAYDQRFYKLLERLRKAIPSRILVQNQAYILQI